MALIYDFKYRPADPDAYKALMDTLGPSIRKSPIKAKLKNKQHNREKTGKIEWFGADKGFGFVAGDDDNRYFIHFTDISKNSDIPRRGDRVAFDVKESEKGLRAFNLIVIFAGGI